MPEVQHQCFVNATIDSVWEYTSDMDKWGPFMTGYQKHEQLNDTESLWVVKGDVGILSRIVEFKITIKEWNEIEKKVVFDILALNEKADGSGIFKAEESLSPQDPAVKGTLLSFKLNIHAGGMIGPVVNVMLKPILKPIATDLANRIRDAVEKLQST